MPPWVIMLLETFLTISSWHGMQAVGAARRSPGLMKRTNSRLSSRRVV
jgi:hypothetical protein